MFASASKLDSADWPMKTSVLRQRKGAVRKQHLLSWAWQQGRGQGVGILRSEKQTERYILWWIHPKLVGFFFFPFFKYRTFQICGYAHFS